jgi:rhomboid protease GluP
MTAYPDPVDTASRPQEPPPQQMVRVEIPGVRPVAAYIILAFTILVFLVQLGTTSSLGYDLPAVWGARWNEMIVNGQLWRLVTPVFLHSTGWLLHIGFNMYALYNLGPAIERLWGHGRFLALYFLAAFAGNVLSFALTDGISIGASTSILGLIAAEGVFLFRNRKVLSRQIRSAITQIVIILAMNLALGLAPGVDMWGHLGGLVGGLLFSWFAAPLLSVEGLMPNLRVVDRRESRDVWMGALLVFGLFALLAGYLITTRLG